MRFWIRKYNIQLEKLPLGLVLWSAGVVLLCASILSVILLFLPIQDKISGEVSIYTSGQPLSLNAPSDGFLKLYYSANELVQEGDLIASIDVRVNEYELEQLKKLVFVELLKTFKYLNEKNNKKNLSVNQENYKWDNNKYYKSFLKEESKNRKIKH